MPVFSILILWVIFYQQVALQLFKEGNKHADDVKMFGMVCVQTNDKKIATQLTLENMFPQECPRTK